jgi:DNA-binding PadR family transcriptional regulator
VYHQIKRFKKNGLIKGIQDVDGKINYEITDEGITAFKKFKDGWRKPIQYIHQNLSN